MRDIETVRSELMALALKNCAHCQGTGLRKDDIVCRCVDRSVFRIVLGKFREIEYAAHLARPMRLDGLGKGARNRGGVATRKHEEFAADVYLSAKRLLTDPTEWAVLRFFHLQGLEWKYAARWLGIDKGTFFHVIYRIEQKLGKMFRELKPYPLFPLDQYFQITTRVVDVKPFPVPEPKPNGIPLVPPLAERKPAPEPEPAPAPEPEPEPEPAPVVWNEETILKQTRELWRTGITSRSIAARLVVMGVPPIGGKWTAMRVRKVLMRAA